MWTLFFNFIIDHDFDSKKNKKENRKDRKNNN